MLFNSAEFLVFFPIVFAIYWSIRQVRIQNVFLLIASYVFYGWWDPRFLSLVVFSSLVDYACGIGILNTNDDRRKRAILTLSLITNLGLLGLFKYYGFFASELALQAGRLGVHIHPVTLHVVLPVGISFYTFQTLSYTIDVYKGNMRPTRDLISFLTYVAFFPQLVAGPIERATSLLPQITKRRRFTFDGAVSGVEQVLWGFFKKIVIADNCAHFVDMAFSSDRIIEAHGMVLIVGAVLFAFQIYGDFSGYSDIAIGVSRMLGIELMTNFSYPYFSRSIGEFWRRWHISLSTWFRDYLYIPLGGSRGTSGQAIRNIFVIFLVSGFWHGANKTFIAWGAYHAFLFLPLYLLGHNRNDLQIIGSDGHISVRDMLRLMVTFVLVCIGWVLFRADNLHQAYSYLLGVFTHYGEHYSFDLRLFQMRNQISLGVLGVMILILLAIEWTNRRRDNTLHFKWYFGGHRLLQFAILMVILFYGEFNQTEFIYFHF
ncbi:MAG: MBOAT family protein [Flavobacteriales bacterium]|nr:MBOAT family protein [Flavobacteriales bacterium]MCB9194157.1 MBOAT family protein [Flavobacteriales bacterium]